MADFKIAHDETMGNEGGYANNPADAGGETYKGIARKFWGSWRGWVIIDRAIASLVKQPPYGTREYRNWTDHLNKQLAGLNSLQELVLAFYRVNFWDKYRLTEIQNQQVANWLYDHAVNGGGRGAMWMQEAAGVTADGDIGPKSVEAINAAIPADLLNKAREIAKNYRLAKVEKYPDQKQFLHSWLSRDGYNEAEIKQIIATA
jgi:lysozyme family protein